MPRVFLAHLLNHRAGQIENADRANARQSVAGSRATRSWTQTRPPISEHSLVAHHLRTAERLEHRAGQLSCALRRHPHSFQACDSRVAPNQRDGRQTVAKRLLRLWRLGRCTQHPPTASCDLQVHSIRHRHIELEAFSAWHSFDFSPDKHRRTCLCVVSGAAPRCHKHDLDQTRKAQQSRVLGPKGTWECEHYLVTTATEKVRTSPGHRQRLQGCRTLRKSSWRCPSDYNRA